jgi:hypothetical protein
MIKELAPDASSECSIVDPEPINVGPIVQHLAKNELLTVCANTTNEQQWNYLR